MTADTNDTPFDAIIIGAGPAGASAAILLARSGWRIALIEKQDFPRRKVCGECIAASNLPLLDALGIGSDLSAHAGPALRQVAVMAGEHMIRAALPPSTHAIHHWGIALGREYLDTLLLRQAARCGVSIFQPWAVRRIEGAPGRYVCHLDKPHSSARMTLAAPLLIAAHGSWGAALSTAAETNPAPVPHRATDLFAFKANFTHVGLEPGLLPVLSFPGGYGGMVMGGHDSMTLAFCIRRDMLAHCRQQRPEQTAAQASFAHVLGNCGSARALLKGAGQQGAWLGVGPLRPGIRLARKGDGIFRIGNAAGEAHPIIGEGMSMAIQSAWLLADLIAPHRRQSANADWQQSLRQEYAALWRRHFAARMRLAALFAHVAMRPALAQCAVPLLTRYPQLLTQASHWSGKVRRVPVQPQLAASELSEINDGQL